MKLLFSILFLFSVSCGPNALEKILQENRGELEAVFNGFQKASEKNKARPDPADVPSQYSFIPLILETEKNGEPHPDYNAVILEDADQLAKIREPFNPNDPSKKGKGVFNRGVEGHLISVGEMLFQGARLGENISQMSSAVISSVMTQIEDQISLAKKIRYVVFLEPGDYQAPVARISGDSYHYTGGNYSTMVRVFDITQNSYILGFPLSVSNSPELHFNLNAGYNSDDSLERELHSELEQKFKQALHEKLGGSL